jgi:hypothetical protein
MAMRVVVSLVVIVIPRVGIRPIGALVRLASPMASATRSRCAHSIHRPSTITRMPTATAR